MVLVSHADRIVFPEVGRTKGDVVAYYERIAPRLLPHVEGRPLSIKRFPKGLAGAGFFQKNVPPHYPVSITRHPIPKNTPSRATSKTSKKKTPDDDVTIYPLVHDAEHLAFLANQGAIELHVPTACAGSGGRPDRIILDLDPPAGAIAEVRCAAFLVRDALADLGLPSVPVATGSKGYHVVAPILPTVDADAIETAVQQLATLLATAHPDELTFVFRIVNRRARVFLDWLRNRANASVIAPYSLRARPRANVATPLAWSELDSTAPDAFTIDDLERLLERPDPLATLARAPADPAPFVASVAERFAAAGLELERFDRFRS
ncbi:MAG: non-homologous end-joining DNA ligase [Polyangiales bacterium]